MRQHDLLVLLCKAYPNVFYITISFKERAVHVRAAKPSWNKTIPYALYMETSLDELSKEILNEYTEATTTRKVLADG